MHKRTLWDGDTFEHNGRTYRIKIQHDSDMGPPWKEHEGHGVVSENRYYSGGNPPKRAGQRILSQERGYCLMYDMQATMKLARKDGWGISAEAEQKLAQSLGRAPTRGEIVAQAVEQDFEHLRLWCADQWQWVYITVTHEDSGETESLGGIESDDDYLPTFADELADEIAHRLDTDLADDIEQHSHLHATP